MMTIKTFFTGIILCSLINLSFAQNDKLIEQVKGNANYYWAEGIGFTISEATEAALFEIARQIEVSLYQSTDRTSHERERAGAIERYSENNIHSMIETSPVILNEYKTIVISEAPDAEVFCYVSKDNVNKMFKERIKRIKDYVKTGLEMEQNLQIDDALRNYYWALSLTKATTENVYYTIDGESKNLLTYLPSKINSVLSNIKVNVSNDQIGEDNSAVLHFTYAGQDISTLEFSYFDGQAEIGPNRVKDGKGIVNFAKVPENNFNINIEYRFEALVENHGDDELKDAFTTVTSFDTRNAFINIPVKVNKSKNKISAGKGVSQNLRNEQEKNNIDNIKPNVSNEKIITKTDSYALDNNNTYMYLSKLNIVEQAIKTNNTQLAKSCFTEQAFSYFERMMNIGKMSITGTSNYKFLHSGNMIIARSLPVRVQTGKQSFIDNITFRFDAFDTEAKIQSLAFTLTKKAEDDIFDAANYISDAARFTLLNFMEDYQTAFAVKDIDYIEKIFSDDAIIIVGNVLQTASKKDVEKANLYGRLDGGKDIATHNNITYKQYTKEKYIENLRRHFKNNKYVHLTYEDNSIKYINTGGLRNKEAICGMQLKQIYKCSNYSDEGYLTLILDMEGKHPMILIRYWQPNKGEIDKLNNIIDKFRFQ